MSQGPHRVAAAGRAQWISSPSGTVTPNSLILSPRLPVHIRALARRLTPCAVLSAAKRCFYRCLMGGMVACQVSGVAQWFACWAQRSAMHAPILARRASDAGTHNVVPALPRQKTRPLGIEPGPSASQAEILTTIYCTTADLQAGQGLPLTAPST